MPTSLYQKVWDGQVPVMICTGMNQQVQLDLWTSHLLDCVTSKDALHIIHGHWGMTGNMGAKHP